MPIIWYIEYLQTYEFCNLLLRNIMYMIFTIHTFIFIDYESYRQIKDNEKLNKCRGNITADLT